MQTKTQSFIEANVNTFIGFLLSYVTLLIVNNLYDMNLTMFEAWKVTVIFTVVSIGRNYFIRRWFDG